MKVSWGEIGAGWTLLVFVLIVANSFAHEKTWPGRQLKQTFPEATRFTSQQVTLSSSQVERIQRAINTRLTTEERSPTFYPAYQADERIGMVIFVDETGENGIIEIGIALNSSGQIAGVKILAHREKSTIKKVEFLGQFIGKSAQDAQSLEDRVVPLNDALQASKAIIRGVKKALLIKREAFGN